MDREEPPDYHAIIAEAALRQLVGGRSVMRRQLRHLAELSSHDKVTLQVLPFAAGAHAAAGSFTVLVVPAFGDVVNIDNTAGRTLLDDTDATDRYNVVFDGLRSRALPEPGSLALIEQLAADL
ncbi:MAG: transcriptional regulator [Actinomycetia bacterium]|nr:transcriptional regulator [Actinomycetes bacterium]